MSANYRDSLKIIFTHNLRSARAIKGWTQTRASKLMGVKLSTYQAYEEGRAWPPGYSLVRLADIYGIKDLLSFMATSNVGIQVEPEKGPDPVAPSLLQLKYEEADIREKLAVNILLGLVDLD